MNARFTLRYRCQWPSNGCPSVAWLQQSQSHCPNPSWQLWKAKKCHFLFHPNIGVSSWWFRGGHVFFHCRWNNWGKMQIYSASVNVHTSSFYPHLTPSLTLSPTHFPPTLTSRTHLSPAATFSIAKKKLGNQELKGRTSAKELKKSSIWNEKLFRRPKKDFLMMKGPKRATHCPFIRA